MSRRVVLGAGIGVGLAITVAAVYFNKEHVTLEIPANDSSAIDAQTGLDPPSSPASHMSNTTHAPKYETTRLQGRAYSIPASFQPQPGDASAVIASLLPQAEAGDADAAFDIYLKVAECINDFNRARRAAPNTDAEAIIPNDCRNLPFDQWLPLCSRWLEAAAERGFVPAQLTYGADPAAVLGSSSDMLSAPDAVSAYRRKAMNYLHRAASSGNVEALQRLANVYASGILTKQDRELAYAYFEASRSASQNMVSPGLTNSLREKYAKA